MLHQLSLIEHADSKQKTPQPMYWLRRFLMVSALGVLLRCRSRLLDPLLPQYYERASDQASPAKKPTNRQKFWAFTFTATEFLMVYPLSGGPMAAIHKASKSGPFQRALGIVYAPVIFVVKKRH